MASSVTQSPSAASGLRCPMVEHEPGGERLNLLARLMPAGLEVRVFVLGPAGGSPLATGVRLLPWFATPMLVSPVAGALSDRIGRRPVIASGLLLQSAGLGWVALKASAAASSLGLVLALLVAGIGISMALPTVPTAVLSAVAPPEMGKASGIANMMQRFGAVFAIAICSSVFAANGRLGSPASVTDGLRPTLAVTAALSLLGAITALAVAARSRQAATGPEPVQATTGT